MAINFFSSKDSEEVRTMYSKSDNIEIMMVNETDKVIADLFDSFLQRHNKKITKNKKKYFKSMKYKLHKASQNRSGSYTDYAKWLENKKATINPKNNENKCFQYAVTVSLNHEQIKIHTERIIKIEAFIDQYDLK